MIDVTKLSLLADKINNCTRCDLYKNGRAKPFIGANPKYIIIAEAPGKDEVEQNTPLIGITGQKMFDFLGRIGYNRNDFIIFNACNCRPIKINQNGRVSNGKPTEKELKLCFDYNMGIIFYSQINKVIALGAYSQYLFLGTTNNISTNVGRVLHKRIGTFKFDVTINYHPSYAFIYSKGRGGLTKFKEIFVNFLKS